ncbi:MAG: monomethylamine:corrinoid methyltransferase [Methanomassiliicoccaceae archaeon]|nr:monomethylamine:corrinoid methyltransferase [Methanomassiliicoccaceae archaeon]
MKSTGFRLCDSHECSQLNELKVDMAAFNMLAGWTGNGDTIMIEQMPIFGGYCGGIEETAICDLATTLASFTLFSGNFHLDGPIHIRWGITTARETLQIAGHVAAAVDANTDLLIANQYYPIAGPCTEMCLLETAAQAITDTGSGREMLSGSAAAKGVAQDKTTGMEARIMGEAALATAGMKVSEVNKVLEKLISSYEKDYAKAPAGKDFRQCYDVLTVKPTAEYLKVYDGAVKKLQGFGLDIKN